MKNDKIMNQEILHQFAKLDREKREMGDMKHFVSDIIDKMNSIFYHFS